MNLNAGLENHLELVVCTMMSLSCRHVQFQNVFPKLLVFFAAWRKKVSMSSGYTKSSKISSWRKGTSNNSAFFHPKKLRFKKKIRRTSRINHSYKSSLKYLICFCNEIMTLAKQIWAGVPGLQKISESSLLGKPKATRKKLELPFKNSKLEMQHEWWSKECPSKSFLSFFCI